jgi:sugar lactone lactonase YvrE
MPMKSLTVGQYEQIASGIYLEGLAVDYKRGTVWYSDVIGGGVHGIELDGTTACLNKGRMWTGGVMMNSDGSVLSSGPGGIMWNRPDTGKSGWLLHEIDGEVINGINEMMPDGTGGIYFGTVDIEKIIEGSPPRPARLYRLTIEGEVISVATELGFANGIMLSADGKHLYYNDTFDSTYVFDVRADLTLSDRRPLLRKEDCDGMALDVQGNLWLTGFRSGDLARLRPDGTLLAPIETPARAITQIRFGGRDMCDFYFTAVPADGGDSLKVGAPLSKKDSFLYRGRSAVPGMAIPPARFNLTSQA